MKKLTLVNAVGSRCLLLSFAVFISACGQSVDAPDGGESNERSHRTPTNQAPDSIINSPAGNSISVVKGQSLNFAGSGTDPDNNTPFSYLWTFDGAGPNSVQQNPGNISFNKVGQYNVRFRVTDGAGLEDPAPAEITVNVTSSGVVVPSGGREPNGTIIEPASNTAIQVGQSVVFRGTASDPDGNLPVHYHWDFDQGAPNSSAQNPGLVTFSQPGVYHVRLTVTDSTGLTDSTSAVRTITVSGQQVQNRSPNGIIQAPAGNQTIQVGQRIDFRGLASDPDGSSSWQWFWDFAGAAPNNTTQNPGSILFTRPGEYRIQLIVRDNLGLADPSPAVVVITVNNSAQSNLPPNGWLQSPSTDLTIHQGDVVYFSGNATDPEGDTNLNYEWQFGMPGQQSTARVPGNVTYSVPGVYRVSLLVTDSSGLADPVPAIRTIIVLQTQTDNLAPDGSINTPNANVTINEGDTVAFTSFGSDPDSNTPLRHVWSFDGGAPNIEQVNPGEVRFSRAGTYQVQLTVIDALGMADPSPAVRTVVVRKVNQPTSNLPPNGVIQQPVTHQTIVVGESIFFTANGTDPDGRDDQVRFRWNFDNAVPISSAQTPGVVNFSRVGTYVVRLTVTDQAGLSDPTPDVRVVVVTPVESSNRAPNGIITPSGNQNITVGQSLRFTGSGSDPDGNLPLRMIWSFGGISPAVFGSDTGDIAFNAPGSYQVVLTVVDSKGLADPTPATLTVTVSGTGGGNQPPQSVLVEPAGNITVQVGDQLNFRGNGSDADGDTPLQWLWRFDGLRSNSTVQNPGSFTFTRAGQYEVSLKVTDSRGLADPTPAKATVTVVASSNLAPQSYIVSPAIDTSVQAGGTVFFAGTAIDPENDLPINYFWNFKGGAANSTQQHPGYIQFNQAGRYVVEMAATDSQGNTDSTPATVTITVGNEPGSGNQAPQSSILQPASDRVIRIGESVLFQGSANDPEGQTMSYFWNFAGSRPNSSSLNPGVVTFNRAGVYDIQFRATDAQGLADSTPASVRITVQENPPTGTNRPPNGVINSPASNMSILLGGTLNFSGQGTDPDNQAVTLVWRFDGARANYVGTTPGAVTFNRSGVFDIELVATDTEGLADPTPATVRVTVGQIAPGNTAPNGQILTPVSNVTIAAGESVRFSGSGSDAQDSVLRYLWVFGGGAANSSAQNPGAIRFTRSGVYRVTLTVTDTDGLSDPSPAEVLVNVTGTVSNQAPQSVIVSPSSNRTIEVGQSVSFAGSGTDSDGDTPFTYSWRFAGGAPNDSRATPGSVQFDRAGVYLVEFFVTDSKGLADATPATRTITVTNPQSQNNAPIGAIISPLTDVTIYAGDQVNFQGNGIDPDGDTPLLYSWSFDGVRAGSSQASPGLVTFANAGVYRVRLTVTDSQGLADPTPVERRIAVSAIAPDTNAPNAVIDLPAADTTLEAGGTLTFRGHGTDPDQDTPFTYLWNYDGAAPNQSVANPGAVSFSRPGTYRVSFNVRDADGLWDPTPATVIVTVRAQNTPTSNQPPNGWISRPTGDVTVVVGDTLSLDASADDPDGNNNNIVYRWNMNGLLPNINVRTPGNVLFDKVGLYRIVLTVTDENGLSDPIPDEVLVSVVSEASANRAPNSLIISPSSNVTIKEGDSLFLDGSGTDPDGHLPLKFYWDMAGATPNMIGKRPGNVMFKVPGTYRLQLKVADSLGLPDATPDSVTVTVLAGSNNRAPLGSIDSPSADVTINAGQSINFQASVADPDGDSVTYLWRFAGAAPNMSVEDPGVIQFNRSGVYDVTFNATDSKGLSFPTPIRRTITVR